jgi:ABC-type polysaccharide/polyol phosphate export permease
LASNGAGLARSAQIQFAVIRALLLREVLTRYGRHNIGFLWLFVEPMLFTLGVSALWTFSGLHQISDLPIVVFALTGYSTVLLWRNMPGRCIGAIAPNGQLMYHRNVRIIDIYLSRIALEAIGATLSIVILSLVFISIGWIAPPENILLVAWGWFLTAWFGAGLATLLGAWSETTEIIEKLWHPLAYLLFPLAGAAFLADAVPEQFRNYVLWIPMVHGTEMIRDGYFGSKFIAHYSGTYLVTVNLVLCLVALALERKASREIVLE